MATPVVAGILLLVRQATTATSSGTPTPTQSTKPANNNNGGVNTPSLFFIALGIGVVFVNVWLILGIKYCCRNRRLAAAANDPERATELQSLAYYRTGRAGMYITSPPPRRRREKKLLTVAEMDERFPVQKYKEWCDHREQNGLSSEGGISSAAVQAMATVAPPVEDADADDAASTHENDVKKKDPQPAPDTLDKDAGIDPALYTSTSKDQDDDQSLHSDEQPTQLAEGSSGGLCAICIDSLEPDDDIRALSCHHVFHSACVTPWLTTRRALCPLCKTDFFVPSRDAAAQVAASLAEARLRRPPAAATTNSGPTTPQVMYAWEMFGSPRASRHADGEAPANAQSSHWPFQRGSRASTQAPVNEPAGAATPEETAQSPNEPGAITPEENITIVSSPTPGTQDSVPVAPTPAPTTTRPSRLLFWRRTPNTESSPV